MSTGSEPIYCNRCGFRSTLDAQFCQSCGQSFPTTLMSPMVPPDVPQQKIAAAPLPLPTRYAGFWIRVVASLFDLIVAFVAFLPVRILLGSAATLAGEDWQMPAARIFFMGRMLRIGCAVIASWLYRAGMESSRFQGTLGKLAVQIKVTDLNGGRISFERATGRHFAKFVSAIALGLGYLMIGFTPKKQGLHDRIAGTFVQYR